MKPAIRLTKLLSAIAFCLFFTTLVDAIPKVNATKSPEEYAAALSAMLGRYFLRS